MENDKDLEGTKGHSSDGWDNLSLDERLYIWLFDNQAKMGNQAERYKRFLENFTAGYDEASLEAYLNFKYDLNLYRYKHPDLLMDGFYAIYNTSEEGLGAKGAEPNYRLIAYMKLAEQYFSSKEEAEAEKANLEAMEGLEPMNNYVIEPIIRKSIRKF